MVLLKRKIYFSKDPEGSIIFQGVQLLPEGLGSPNANFYRNPYSL